MKINLRQVWGVVFITLMTCSLAEAGSSTKTVGACANSINALNGEYEKNEKFKKLMDSAFKNMQPLPMENNHKNRWIGKDIADLTIFLEEWCTFLPTMKDGHDDGLKNIEDFTAFYYHNPDGVRVVQDSPGREIFQDFSRERGVFMDSEASTVSIKSWMNDGRTEIQDYNVPNPSAVDGGFKSFNEFFTRTLKDQKTSRPQTMPERDYVISAPTDCIMNSIPQLIVSKETQIATKGNQALNIDDMLNNSAYAEKFIGGTALSCVLMPNTYHYYHSPVNGKVVESKIVEDAYYGYDDFATWVNKGNVGYNGTDFGQFENFKRGYFIVDAGKYGHVALIAVGLNTISSIVFEEKFRNLKGSVPIKRGDALGKFQYGGSMFIMIFEPNRYKSDAIQVRLGNQIGTFD